MVSFIPKILLGALWLLSAMFQQVCRFCGGVGSLFPAFTIMGRITFHAVTFVLLLSCIDVFGKPALNGKWNEDRVLTTKMNIFVFASLINEKSERISLPYFTRFYSTFQTLAQATQVPWDTPFKFIGRCIAISGEFLEILSFGYACRFKIITGVPYVNTASCANSIYPFRIAFRIIFKNFFNNFKKLAILVYASKRKKL